MSPIHAEVEIFVRNEHERLLRRAVDPWAFFNAGPPMQCNDFYGKQISYQGIKFEGSPRHVFWNGFIEPFLEDLIIRAVDHTARLAADRGVDLDPPLVEVGAALRGAIGTVYLRMQDIDRRLRGGGYPERVAAEDIQAYRNAMERRLDQILAARHVRKSIWARLSAAPSNHPLLFWALTGVITLLAAAIPFLLSGG